MIPAQRNKLFERLFLAYTRRALRRHFHRVHAAGLENVEKLDRQRPIILYCNHSSWWDGMMIHVLSRDVIHAEPFAMMEEKQMERYGFFKWIGAFSVVRESPRQAVGSMRYAASLFTGPDIVLWIFPQGVLLPNDTRPLGFYPGVARVARMVSGVQLVPVAVKYEFMMEQRPEAFVLFGCPKTLENPNDTRSLTGELEHSLTALLDTLRNTIARNDRSAFSVIVNGTSSINVLYDRIRQFGKHA